MQEIYVSKLSEYLNAIERLKTYYPNQIIVHNPTSLSYLYRGLANKEYELLPGLFRKQQDIFDDEGHSVENYRYLAFGNEKDILQSFIHEASNYIQLSTTDYSRWAEYAQHYGVPTRFLDWSRNPLVALYFACRDQKEKDGKVWLLHARNYDRAYPEKTAAIMDISRREMLDKLIQGEPCSSFISNALAIRVSSASIIALMPSYSIFAPTCSSTGALPTGSYPVSARPSQLMIGACFLSL